MVLAKFCCQAMCNFCSRRKILKEKKKRNTNKRGTYDAESGDKSDMGTYGCTKYNTPWCKVLDSLPRNLCSFVIRYLSNCLASGTNTVKWGIATSAKHYST